MVWIVLLFSELGIAWDANAKGAVVRAGGRGPRSFAVGVIDVAVPARGQMSSRGVWVLVEVCMEVKI